MEQILIVEDDTDINNMVASALTKAGYECKQSFSGTEAMLYLNKEKFSVIILDLMLPGKSGNSIVEEIKPYLDTSIIVVSAKDELDTKVNLLFSGADDYITKPFEIDELVARVAVQIRKHSTDKTESVYHYKDMVLNITEHSISVLGHPISFTRQGIAEVRETLLRLNKEKGLTIIISSHILEELSKIATNYAIIDKGQLVKELSREELEATCREHIEIKMEHPDLALPVLDALGFKDYRVADENTIHIFERLNESGKITMELSRKNIYIHSISVTNESIEDYFLRLTGGVDHA